MVSRSPRRACKVHLTPFDVVRLIDSLHTRKGLDSFFLRHRRQGSVLMSGHCARDKERVVNQQITLTRAEKAAPVIFDDGEFQRLLKNSTGHTRLFMLLLTSAASDWQAVYSS